MSLSNYRNINNCVGAAIFLTELERERVNLEMFIFIMIQHVTNGEDEVDLVSFVRLLRNLKVMCLNYTTQRSMASEEGTETFEPLDIGGKQKPIRDEFPSTSSSPQAQEIDCRENCVEVYCKIPLQWLLGPSLEYSLHSISPLQDPRWKISDVDLAFVAKACPYVMDLAIPCPDLEKMVFLKERIDPHMQHQSENLAVSGSVVHRSYCLLTLIEYPQGVSCLETPSAYRRLAGLLGGLQHSRAYQH